MASTQSAAAAAAAAAAATMASVPIPAPGGRSNSIASLNTKARSDSVSSISTMGTKSRSNSVVSVTESPVAESPVSSYWSYGRRESRVQFASLVELKRSNNPAQMAIRDGIHDQRRTPGMIGRMWHQYVYGDTILTRPRGQ